MRSIFLLLQLLTILCTTSYTTIQPATSSILPPPPIVILAPVQYHCLDLRELAVAAAAAAYELLDSTARKQRAERAASSEEVHTFLQTNLSFITPSTNVDTFSIQELTNVIASHNHGDTKPIVHAFLDRPCLALNAPSVQDSIGFLGLTPIVVPDPSSATYPRTERVGRFIQEILDNNRDTLFLSCCISWEWSLHLGLLKANALPKSSAHGDSFLILPIQSIPELVWIKYLYDDTSRFFGGNDPLLCKTNEHSFPLPKENIFSNNDMLVQVSNYATAVAYTVLLGNGMNGSDSAWLAHSVGLHVALRRNLSLTNTMKQTISLMIQEPVVRKRYIEYGYR